MCRVGVSQSRSQNLVVKVGQDGMGHLDWSHLVFSTREAALEAAEKAKGPKPGPSAA